MTTLKDILDAVYDFVAGQRDRLPPESETEDHAYAALAWHAVHGTLAVTWDGGRPVGVAIAFRTSSEAIRKAEAQGKSVFDWKAGDPAGDAVYLNLALTTQPGALAVLARYFLRRNPEWKGLRQFAHRRDQLKEIPGLLERLAGPNKEEPSHG